MFPDQQLGGALDQLARFRLADVGQILAGDRARLAAEPRIGFVRVGMNSGDDNLLPRRQETRASQTPPPLRATKSTTIFENGSSVRN